MLFNRGRSGSAGHRAIPIVLVVARRVIGLGLFAVVHSSLSVVVCTCSLVVNGEMPNIEL